MQVFSPQLYASCTKHGHSPPIKSLATLEMIFLRKKERSEMIDEETVHIGRSVESVQNYIQRQQVSWLTLMVLIIVNINIINPVRVLGSAHIMRISLALASL